MVKSTSPHLFQRFKKFQPSGQALVLLVGFGFGSWALWRGLKPLLNPYVRLEEGRDSDRLEQRGAPLVAWMQRYLRGEIDAQSEARQGFSQAFDQALGTLRERGLTPPITTLQALLESLHLPEQLYATALGQPEQRLKNALAGLEQTLENLGYFCSVSLQQELEFEILARLCVQHLSAAQKPSALWAQLPEHPGLEPFRAFHGYQQRLLKEGFALIEQAKEGICPWSLLHRARVWRADLKALEDAIPWPDFRKLLERQGKEQKARVEVALKPFEEALQETQKILEAERPSSFMGFLHHRRRQPPPLEIFPLKAAEKLPKEGAKAFEDWQAQSLALQAAEKQAAWAEWVLTRIQGEGEEWFEAEVQNALNDWRRFRNSVGFEKGAFELHAHSVAVEGLNRKLALWREKMKPNSEVSSQTEVQRWGEALEWIWRVERTVHCFAVQAPDEPLPFCPRCGTLQMTMRALLAQPFWEKGKGLLAARDWKGQEAALVQSLVERGVFRPWAESRSRAWLTWLKEVEKLRQHEKDFPYERLQGLSQPLFSTETSEALEVFEPWATEVIREWELLRACGRSFWMRTVACPPCTRAKERKSQPSLWPLPGLQSEAQRQVFHRALEAWEATKTWAEELRDLWDLKGEHFPDPLPPLLSPKVWGASPLPLVLTWPSAWLHCDHRQALAEGLRLLRQPPSAERDQALTACWIRVVRLKAAVEALEWPLWVGAEEELQAFEDLSQQAVIGRSTPGAHGKSELPKVEPAVQLDGKGPSSL